MGLFDDIALYMKSGFRAVDVARALSTQGVKAIAGMLQGKSEKGPEHLRQIFEYLGATYIKLGQLIASAPGLFPEGYVEEMQKCLDAVAPIPYKAVKKVLHEEFEGREDEIFMFIDKEPLASASIAQVHAARLSTGEEVVIKVQRPGIKDTLISDLNLMYIASAVFDTFAPSVFRTGLKSIVKEFHRTLMEEVDFVQEGKNNDEFREFLSKIGETGVTVPKIYHEFSTMKVLTMERFFGVSLIDLDTIKNYVDDPEETLVTALNTWMQSLLFCGFFHADVHAGNLMVLRDGRIGFIDFGIVGRMGEEIWGALVNMIQGLATFNYRLLARSLVDMNAADTDVDMEEFAKQLEGLFSEIDTMGQDFMLGGAVDEAKMNDLLTRMVRISEDNGLRVPREFVLLFKQVLYFDRYIRLLAPELDIINSEKVNLNPRLGMPPVH